MVKKFFTDESINTLVTESKKYADSAATKVKNDLLNGAGAAYDTLKELGDLIDDNQDAISALQTVASGKADKSDLTSHTGDTTVHITSTERTNWNAAKTHADSDHAPSNAQANVIESIKVNGTAQTISSKSVNITVPTKASDISAAPSSHVGDSTHITSTERTNWNAAYSHSQASHAPSNAQANVIESVKVNGTAQTISSKSVNISVPTKASDISAAPSSHVGDSSHVTSDERTNWNAAYSHSQASHAPSDAEKNQNAFSNVKVGSTTVAADTTTDTLTLVAGTNVTITPDATNDKITIAATDTVYTHPTYTAKSSGLYKITVDSTGHVSGTASVAKSDITALGIPAQDTTYTHPSSHPASMITGLATVATSGSYNDLTNKPTIPAAYTHPTSHPASMITGLATVATSGSYNDLTNKPTIPSAYTHPASHPASMITGLATVATSGSYNDLSNKPTIPSYGVATSSALGLVKSGTDITVDSSGNVSVNDDSHNHVISNIDNLQTTLDAKQATITGGATTITSSNLTASRALVSDASGKVAVSAVTSTELGYLDGVTSAIQTQLNNKLSSSGGTLTGNLKISKANSPKLELATNTNNGYTSIYQHGGSLSISSGMTEDSDISSIELKDPDGDLTTLAQLRTKISGVYYDYKLYGEHNKPTPSDIGAMDLSSNQTASGIKTFENGINIGNATMTYDETNKRIVISVQ